MIQFLYILAGGVIDYLLYASLRGGFVFWIIALPVAAFSLALAFLKFQDQPLSHFITAGLVYYTRPKERSWQRKGVDIEMVKEPLNKKVEAPRPVKRQTNRSELDKLAYMLDTHSQLGK